MHLVQNVYTTMSLLQLIQIEEIQSTNAFSARCIRPSIIAEKET